MIDLHLKLLRLSIDLHVNLDKKAIPEIQTKM